MQHGMGGQANTVGYRVVLRNTGCVDTIQCGVVAVSNERVMTRLPYRLYSPCRQDSGGSLAANKAYSRANAKEGARAGACVVWRRFLALSCKGGLENRSLKLSCEGKRGIL